MTEDALKAYVATVQAILKKNLQKHVGMELHVYQANQGGVVEIKLARDTADRVVYEKHEESVNNILKRVNQRLVGGDIDSVQLLGTNISLEGDRILFIKGQGSEWGIDAAKDDVARVLNVEGGASS